MQKFRLQALTAAERPPILKAYFDQFRREVQRFFFVPAGLPIEVFTPLAPRDPAFELLPEAEAILMTGTA